MAKDQPFPLTRVDSQAAKADLKPIAIGRENGMNGDKGKTDSLATAVPAVLEAITFNADGLVAAIAQQFDTGEVLMMAWMNSESITETLRTGWVCYWSRSRRKLWRKGETSGQTQALKDFRWDCDSDTVLLLVDQRGVACHTGRRNCFFNAIRDGKPTAIAEVEVDPKKLYG
jgi:phosphoribosyl-AMP cyclohydrolase|tara:strand:+ start:62 stop:577 length:516 start_codon:yes stop_codon:yes gene_type:complete